MIKSPCISFCKMNLQDNLCVGCGRSINQITNWTHYTEKEKDKIIENVKKKFKNNILIKKY